MTKIFKCLAGSRLYGTSRPDSDTDYKSVHLPTKREILLGNGKPVVSKSTGSSSQTNGADDTDDESFTLQRFLKLASDMQTIPVEMLFVMTDPLDLICEHPVWDMVVRNRHKILSNNTDTFVGYCKGQAVRYSMRGSRLETYKMLCAAIGTLDTTGKWKGVVRVGDVIGTLSQIEGVKVVEKTHNKKIVEYLDVFGRQVPEGLPLREALKVYEKPVREAGRRANAAMDAGGADWKALYHAVRIVDEGIDLFRDGEITFPCQNRDYLMQIRSGELKLDAVLDHFDEKLEILMGIGDKSPLADAPDRLWIDDFVSEVYEEIVRA